MNYKQVKRRLSSHSTKNFEILDKRNESPLPLFEDIENPTNNFKNKFQKIKLHVKEINSNIFKNIINKIRYQSKFILYLSIFQFLMSCFILIITLTLNDTFSGYTRNLATSILGMSSSIFGIWSGLKQSAVSVKFFFILEMWLLSLLTIYFFIGIESNETIIHRCKPKMGNYVLKHTQNNLKECENFLILSKLRVFFASIFIPCVFILITITFNLNNNLIEFTNYNNTHILNLEQLEERFKYLEQNIYKNEQSEPPVTIPVVISDKDYSSNIIKNPLILQ
jgi:hypothetical protein